MAIPELNIIEKRPLSVLWTVSGRRHVIAMSQDEAIAALQGAMQAGSPFIIVPTITGKLCANIGAVETIEPFQQKGEQDAGS